MGIFLTDLIDKYEFDETNICSFALMWISSDEGRKEEFAEFMSEIHADLQDDD